MKVAAVSPSLTRERRAHACPGAMGQAAHAPAVDLPRDAEHCKKAFAVNPFDTTRKSEKGRSLPTRIGKAGDRHVTFSSAKKTVRTTADVFYDNHVSFTTRGFLS